MKYPIGIQSFDQIRNEGYVYVDKTALIYQLVTTGKIYFLSRPRRFGKSLLVSTLEHYFLGHKELFKGLAMEQLEQDWFEYPVFHIDFNNADFTEAGCGPFLRPSGLHHKAHIAAGGCRLHFLQILRAGTVLAFQIAAAHIDEYGPGALRPHGRHRFPPAAVNGQCTVPGSGKPGTGFTGGCNPNRTLFKGSLWHGFRSAAPGTFLLQAQTSSCAQQHAPGKQQRGHVFDVFAVHKIPPLMV